MREKNRSPPEGSGSKEKPNMWRANRIGMVGGGNDGGGGGPRKWEWRVEGMKVGVEGQQNRNGNGRWKEWRVEVLGCL